LLKRGRTRDAQSVLDEARGHCARSDHGSSLVDCAVLSGAAWIDLCRLDEAESVLGAAVAAAKSQKDATRTALVSRVLARSAFWRGRYSEAQDALKVTMEQIDDGHTDAQDIRICTQMAMSRVAVGLCDLGGAVASAVSALELAQRTGKAGLIAGATCAA